MFFGFKGTRNRNSDDKGTEKLPNFSMTLIVGVNLERSVGSCLGRYQVRFIPGCPALERPGTVWTNDLEKTFRKGLAIPKDAMVTSKCIDHFVPSD